jgi:hypothetical protein
MKVRRRVATRSALALARKALAVGSAAFPAYGSPFSKKDFTQGQLFAMLCLKQFLRQDYRGFVVLLSEWSDLRQVLQLKKVPHYCTLCYAQARLATRSGFHRLLDVVSDDGFAQGLADAPPEVAIDATGFESRHCSRYFVQRLWRTPASSGTLAKADSGLPHPEPSGCGSAGYPWTKSGLATVPACGTPGRAALRATSTDCWQMPVMTGSTTTFWRASGSECAALSLP